MADRNRDAYPAVLELLINARRSLGIGRVEVLNGGEGGFTTFQSLLAFKREYLAYEPDVVTLNFGANDGNNNLAIWVNCTDEEFWERLQRTADSPWLSAIHDTLSHSKTAIALYRIEIFLGAKLWPKRVVQRVPVASFRRNLREFYELCKSRDIELVMMCEPHRNIHARSDYRSAMREQAEAFGVTYVDLQHLAFPDENRNRLLFVDEVHPTAEGHRLIASVLAERLDLGNDGN